MESTNAPFEKQKRQRSQAGKPLLKKSLLKKLDEFFDPSQEATIMLSAIEASSSITTEITQSMALERLQQDVESIPLKAQELTVPLALLKLSHERKAGFWQLIHHEIYNLWKQRVFWMLLAFELLLVLASWCALVFAASQNITAFQSITALQGPHLRGSLNAFSFIATFGQPMTLGRRFGEFVALSLGAFTFARDYSSGTVRLIPQLRISRFRYLLAKLLTSVFACMVLLVTSILLIMFLTSFLAVFHEPTPTLFNMDGQTFMMLLNMCLGIYENFFLCLLLGAALSIIARSVAFGITVGSGYMIAEDAVAQILHVVSRSAHWARGYQIVNVLFTPNLNAVYANTLPSSLAKTLDHVDGVIACDAAVKAHTCIPVTNEHALLVSLVWMLVLGVVSTFLFLIRDARK